MQPSMFNGSRDFAIHGGEFNNVGTQHNGDYNITNRASGGTFHVSPNYGLSTVNNGAGNTRSHYRPALQPDRVPIHASRPRHVPQPNAGHHSDIPCTRRPVKTTDPQSLAIHQTEEKNNSELSTDHDDENFGTNMQTEEETSATDTGKGIQGQGESTISCILNISRVYGYLPVLRIFSYVQYAFALLVKPRTEDKKNA